MQGPACTSMMPSTTRATRAALSFALLALLPSAHAGPPAPVMFYEHPPTVEEIQAALAPAAPRTAAGPSTAAAGDGHRPKMRGIDLNWGSESIAEPATSGSPPTLPTSAPSGPALALPIAFESGSARIAPTSRAYLDALAGVLMRDPQLRLVVEGHTDAAGNPRTNLMLSWERAFSVFRTLVDKYGVDPVRLRPIGKGSMEPMPGAAPTDPTNRRVQFRAES